VGGDEPLAAKCVARIRAQDRALDGGMPGVLFVPLTKRHRTKAMIKKCTEIGAGRMMLIALDRMEGDASHNDDGNDGGGVSGDVTAWLEDKLGLILIKASKQCERLDVLAIARDVALTARDNNGGSLLLPSRSGELWTVWDFLPR
jgi:16S rRNA U1498 N3-methylase RsmE